MALGEPNWNQVARELGPSLYKYFQGRVGLQPAEDLAQECLLRLFRKYQQGEWNEKLGTLRMFAYGIARLIVLEHQRLPVFSEVGLESAKDLQDLDEDINKQQLHNRLRDAIHKLSPIQQECLFLTMDEDLSQEQIAILVGVPLNTVKSHIHRAKESLKIALNPLMERL